MGGKGKAPKLLLNHSSSEPCYAAAMGVCVTCTLSTCHRHTSVDTWALPALVCKRLPGRFTAADNDIVSGSFVASSAPLPRRQQTP